MAFSIRDRKNNSHLTTYALVSLVVVFAALGVFATFTKYATLGYNALDFAIFRNILDQTIRGNLFGMTIHPHSYFGDHLSPILLALAPLYAIVQHGELLAVLQIVFVLVSLWPLSLLLQRLLPRPFRAPMLAAFLLLPISQNLVVFEFELVVLALPLLLAALVAYERQRYGWYALWLALALLVREDLGLVLIGLALVALVDRRSKRWWLVPLLLGAGWMLLGILLGGLMNAEQYKFLAYYGWLGDTPLAMIQMFLTQPWLVFAYFFRPQNLLFILLLLLLTAGLPLFRASRLLPALPLAAALFLTSFGADAITIRTHYPALFLPFLLWASIYGMARLRERPPRWISGLGPPPVLATALLLVVGLYGTLSLGPFRPTSVRALLSIRQDPRTSVAQELSNDIPNDARIAASYGFLPWFGNRPEVYSLHYAFRGRRQLSSRPYELPSSVDTILYDSNDYRFYDVQYGNDESIFRSGDNRLRAILEDRGFTLVALVDSFLFFRRTGESTPLPYSVGERQPYAAVHDGSPIRLVATSASTDTFTVELWTVGSATVDVLPVSLTWELTEPTAKPYHLRLEYVDEKGKTKATKWYELAYGLLSTDEWIVGTPISVPYRFLVPNLAAGEYQLRLTVESAEGYVTLDPKLSATVAVTKRATSGSPIILGAISR